MRDSAGFAPDFALAPFQRRDPTAPGSMPEPAASLAPIGVLPTLWNMKLRNLAAAVLLGVVAALLAARRRARPARHRGSWEPIDPLRDQGDAPAVPT